MKRIYVMLLSLVLILSGCAPAIRLEETSKQPAAEHVPGDPYAGDELISGDAYDFVMDEDGFICRINVKGTYIWRYS